MVWDPTKPNKAADQSLGDKSFQKEARDIFEISSAPESQQADLISKYSTYYTDGVDGNYFFWYQYNDETLINENPGSVNEHDSYDDEPSIYENSGSVYDYALYNVQPPIYSLLNQSTSYKESSISRVNTHEEHVEFLKNSIMKADNAILISSYGISMSLLQKIEKEIASVRSTGIGVLFFNSDRKPCSPEVMNFIKKYNIMYEKIKSHSKVVAVDDDVIAVGSYNWLSSDGASYKDGLNGSLVLLGEELCQGWHSQFRVFFRQYIHKIHGNIEKTTSFKSIGTTDMPVYFDQRDGSRLTYLPTLNAHRKFLDSIFNIAQTSLTICVPFINKNSGFLEDLPAKKFVKAANRGVNITIVCQEKYVSKLKDIYGSFLESHKNITLISKSNLHGKSIVIDECLIAEGSFNWMSASRSEDSPYYNHEITIVCEGPMAKPLINDFNKRMQLDSITQGNGNTLGKRDGVLKRSRVNDNDSIQCQPISKKEILISFECFSGKLDDELITLLAEAIANGLACNIYSSNNHIAQNACNKLKNEFAKRNLVCPNIEIRHSSSSSEKIYHNTLSLTSALKEYLGPEQSQEHAKKRRKF
tara:strand:- start:31613 stop:33370 length:1758 start_codon:yes stop_codon:yes gene_type:complete